jgi:hypothetical protein
MASSDRNAILNSEACLQFIYVPAKKAFACKKSIGLE